MSPIPARRATAEDLDEVLSIITAAFAEDPLWSHALASPEGTIGHHARFWRLFIEGAMRYSWVWLTEGGEATAVWIPPGGTEMTEAQEEELGALAKQLLGHRAQPYFQLLESFDVAHPRAEPHYYLSLLGTHPKHRGRGFGMDLLRHNLAVIDGEGLPAYLESSNPANNRRYEGVGFLPIGQFSYPGGGPLVTTMWRAALTGADGRPE
jgi:GNAT superfamily N-acetyltransferase